jgi:hypothetical protein
VSTVPSGVVIDSPEAGLLAAIRCESDDYIRVCATVAAVERDVQVARGNHAYAELLNTVAALCCQVRDERRTFYRAVESELAESLGVVAGEATREPDDEAV